MDELDIGLSKKSKIIEIGSVEKKLWLFKVGEISKKIRFRLMFPCVSVRKMTQISENGEKFSLGKSFTPPGNSLGGPGRPGGGAAPPPPGPEDHRT